MTISWTFQPDYAGLLQVIEVYSLFDAAQYLAATGALPSSTLDSDNHLFKVAFDALSAKVTEEEDDYEDADFLLPQKEDRHSQVHGGAMKRLQELRSSDAELLFQLVGMQISSLPTICQQSACSRAACN